MLSSARVFQENSLIVACCSFGKLEIKTLAPNRLKNQTNDTLRLLDHNSNLSSPLCSFLVTKSLPWVSIAAVFYKNSLIMACYTFHSVKIRTLRSNKFKNQTNDIFKLLGDNCNHQHGWVFLNKKLSLSIVVVLT